MLLFYGVYVLAGVTIRPRTDVGMGKHAIFCSEWDTRQILWGIKAVGTDCIPLGTRREMLFLRSKPIRSADESSRLITASKFECLR